MKFTMKVGYLEGSPATWLEHENRSEITSEAEATEWAQRTLRNFNATLRPHEQARRLVAVTFDHEENKERAQHNWTKTNLMTVLDPRGGLYDTLKCTFCGITAKRYGLTCIKLDPKYRAKGYQVCPPEAKKEKM